MDRVGIKAVVEGFEQYVRQTAQLEKSTDRFTASTQRAASTSRQTGGAMGLNVGALTRAGLAVAGIGSAAYLTQRALVSGIQTGAAFEVQLDKIGVVSGATGSELAALTEQARELGRSTIFTASEVASAQLELVKAGLEVNEVLGAMPGVLALAAAGEIELADAARVATQAMTVFWLSAGEIGHVADVITAASLKSSASVGSLSSALESVGPIAADLGISLEDTVAFLAMLEQGGIRGAEAGTSLRRILLSLLDPTAEAAQVMEDLGINAFDAAGNFVGLAKFSDNLQDAMSGLDDKSRQAALAILFDTFAITGATRAAQEGAEGLADFQFAVEDVGSAAEVSAEQTDNLRGDWEELSGSAEDLAIELEQRLDPALRGIVFALEENIDFLRTILAGDWDTLWAGFSEPVQGFALAVAEGIDQAVGAVIAGINVLIKAYNAVADKIPGLDSIGELGEVDLSGALRASIARGNEVPGVFQGPSLEQELAYQRQLARQGGGGGRSYTPPERGGGGAKSVREEISALQAFLEEITGAQLLDQMVASFGEAGGAAVTALITAIQSGAEADGRRVSDSVDALIDEARERGVPNADELGAQLIAAVTTALTEGTPEAIAAAEAAVVALATAIGFNAVTAFDAAIADAVAENALIEKLGEQGAAVMLALEAGIREQTPETGRSLSDAVDAVLDALASSDLTGADQMGSDLVQAVADAIESGTPEAVQAVYDMVDAINDALERASGKVELTVANFMEGVNQAIFAANTRAAAGDAGLQIIQGLVDALLNGKPEAAAAAADAAGGIMFELYDKLDAATAARLGAALMAALTAAIQGGGQAAIDAVLDVLTVINSALDAAAAAVAVPEAPELFTGIEGGVGGPSADAELQARERALEQARRHRIEQADRLGAAIVEALRRQYAEEERLLLDSIREQRDALSAWADEQIRIRQKPLLDELEAMDAVERENRLKDIKRRLALAYDAKERARIQRELDDFLRDERRDQLRDQLREIEDQVATERQTKQDALDAEEQAIRDHYAKLTDEAVLQAEALRLLQAENQEAIVELLKSYYPEWNEAGRSLGEQLIEGLQSSGVEQAVKDILDLIKATDEALSDLFYEPPAAGGGGAGGGGTAIIDKTPPKPPPTKAPNVPVPAEEGPAYSGVPGSAIQQGWNLATTGTAGPSMGGDYTGSDVYFANPDGSLTQVPPGGVIPPGTAVWIYKYARGTRRHPGGLALVGEQGPELVNLPRGSQVIPDYERLMRDALMPAGVGRGGDTYEMVIDFRGAHLTGSVRDNTDMIEGIVRRTMARMGTREARHWGINR